jgi:lipopolysaccharide biosynthesis glycosyltransferase
MNIVYSSSDSYSMLCGISMLSVFENNQEVEDIHAFIIDNNISEANKNNLLIIANRYKRQLTFVNKVNLEKLTGTKINVGPWNISTFFRLFLGAILPKDVERVMYFDCDTIIRHNLTEIYNLDLGNCIVAGADDCRSDNYRKEIGLNHGDVYINNGFLLINLKKWRELSLDSEFISFISSHHGDITYVDQGVLNGVLSKKKLIKEIPPKYNAQRIFFDFKFKEILKLRKPEHHCTEEIYNEAITDPIIVHFTPTFITGTRPWNLNDKHKFTSEFLHYKLLTPWANIPLTKDSRKAKRKIATKICRLLPRRFMIAEVSVIHSKIYPFIRKMKDRKSK